MPVPSSYLGATRNLSAILASIQKAGVPTKFSHDFLKKLGYPSSNDRPMIPLLKALGFTDPSGAPLDRYRRFRDESQAGAVMAEAMREAYADVFAVNQQAHTLSSNSLKGVFARVTGKSDAVTEKMAATFIGLAAHADWASTPALSPEPAVELAPEPESADPGLPEVELPVLRMHHDIHIHLPESKEIAVYDAIFRALRQNFGT